MRAQSAIGISHALARQRRSVVTDVRYALSASVAADARWLLARQRLSFVLAAPWQGHALHLDWRPRLAGSEIGRALESLRVNGEPCDRAKLDGGHIVIGGRQLNRGSNRIELEWRAPIDAAVGPLVRYRDVVDGHVYVYSLFVPADASTVFPCFDQPDLKSRFEFCLTVPLHWTAISNAPLESFSVQGRRRTLRFEPTEPISTYAFAFAAGPFVELCSKDPRDATGLWVRRSQHRRAARHADEILRLNRIALGYCARYFAHRFPFAKYDLVLIPELAYRGMEHAGATFLNEAAALPEHACTMLHAAFERAQLVFHETAHQWMGDLVTMRWFDDLWLKEGFANFIAFALAERAFPRSYARVCYYDHTLSALESDASGAARALHRPLPDLADAKAAYDSIVYAKAPAILRQLERMLGRATFQRGVRDLVRRNAYGSFDWRDLLDALGRACARPMDSNARNMILQPGARRIRGLPALQADTERRDYALVELDRAEVETVLRALPRTRSAPMRARYWNALWTAVLALTLDPRCYVDLAAAILAREDNDRIVARVLSCSKIVIDRCLADGDRDRLSAALESAAWDALVTTASAGLKLVWLHALPSITHTGSGCKKLAAMIERSSGPSALLTPADRLAAAGQLVALEYWTPQRGMRRLVEGRRRTSRRFFAHCLEAATRDPQRKRGVLRSWLHESRVPEHWIAAAMPFFNHPAHAALTLPLLSEALVATAHFDARKIFFADRWIGSFVGGQRDARAARAIRELLRDHRIDAALSPKVREALYLLDRCIASRTRWARP